MRIPRPYMLMALAAVLCLSACEESAKSGSPEHIRQITAAITPERLARAGFYPGDWLGPGRTPAGDYYSPLRQIDTGNVERLGLAWRIDLGTTRGIEATPLIVDGILYQSGPWSVVYAIDARKSEIIWTYDPEVPRTFAEKACCDVVNRGLALYRGHVFVGTLDGRLVSLDAATGLPAWEVLTVDTTQHYSITGAPRIAGDKVVIGNAGADFGTRGYVTAYDARSGEQAWRFYIVPGDPAQPFESPDMEMAAQTWTGEWWKYGGGGNAWDGMAWDPELELLYIGTGNGGPWNRLHRSPGGGDNLYLSSIVALDPETGRRVWHYQTTPGDSWDYTATQPLILADLEIGGTLRQVIMQAPKNGFFYVLDRRTGELISAKPYVYVNWAREIDLQSGRPVESDFSRYEQVNAEIFPGPAGGHSWQPMAYSPQTGLVYIPAREEGFTFGHRPDWQYAPGNFNTGTGHAAAHPTRRDTAAPRSEFGGRLIAWDPVAQEEKWRVPYKAAWNGGVLATAGGLVFQGTAEGKFVAYDATSGKTLWQADLGSGIIAAPASYEVDGKQYISLAVGWGGVVGQGAKFTERVLPGAIYTFVLDGQATLPVLPPPPVRELVNLPITADAATLATGRRLFNQYCARCHAPIGSGGGSIPDLGYSAPAIFEAFDQIVGEGALLAKGMPRFGDRLDGEAVAAIRAYVLHAAAERHQP